MPLGVGFTPFETRADVIVRLGVLADELGIGRVEVAEAWSHDSLILLAELAQRTTRIGLGTSVISVWGRTPGTIALGAAGLQRCSDGRFTLGLGAGSPPMTEGFHGLAWERPLARLRRTLTDVRALLAGERLPDPAPGARPLRLGVVPAAPVPIGAGGPVGRVDPAGGRARRRVGSVPVVALADRGGPGAARRGRVPGRHPTPTHVWAGVPVALGPDERSARRLAAWWLATYATRMGPLYPRMLARALRHGRRRRRDRRGGRREPASPTCPRPPRSSPAR